MGVPGSQIKCVVLTGVLSSWEDQLHKFELKITELSLEMVPLGGEGGRRVSRSL